MRYTVILNCTNGLVNKFECPNPECEEILSVPIGTDDEFERRTELDCTCGAKIHLIRRGRLIHKNGMEKRLKKEKEKKNN